MNRVQNGESRRFISRQQRVAAFRNKAAWLSDPRLLLQGLGKPCFAFAHASDDEPFRARSNRRESAQTSRMISERTHVRCYKVHGAPLFAFAHELGP